MKERILIGTPTAILLAFVAIFIALAAGITAGQCVDHPVGRTAVRFDNQTSRELAFFIDDSDEMIFAPRTISPPIEVTPGEHLLRARGYVNGEPVWVWVRNHVPRGKLCTWIVEDPATSPSARKEYFVPSTQ